MVAREAVEEAVRPEEVLVADRTVVQEGAQAVVLPADPEVDQAAVQAATDSSRPPFATPPVASATPPRSYAAARTRA